MEQDVFGDFELEAGWAQTGAGERLRDRACKVTRLELGGRKVDADPELLCPARSQAAALAQAVSRTHSAIRSEIGEVLTTGMNSPGETRPRSG